MEQRGPVDISVVIPAHNREATIERTLRSVLAQEGSHFEIVVVDDGSVDTTAARARAVAGVDPRVQVLRQANAGVSSARNAGSRAATGRYLTFLDCDDEAEPGWLAAYVGALDHGADLVFSPGRARQAGRADKAWTVAPLGPAFADIEGLFNPGMFALRTADFAAVGGYAVALRFSENNELGLRITEHLAAAGAVTTMVIDRAFVVIHMDPDGRSHADTPAARFESALYLVDRHGERLQLDPRLHASYWAIAGVAATRLERTADARRCFAAAARANPRDPKHAARLALAWLPAAGRRRWKPAPA